MRIGALLVAALLTLGACADDSGDASDDAKEPAGSPSASASPSASPSADEPEPLPTGKDDLEVQASSHLSPDLFAPELRLDLQFSGLVGWTSVHRGADGFDLGLPGPDADAPLVAIAFLAPAEATAAEALAAVRDAATAAGAQVKHVSGPFDELGATAGVDLTGGEGQVVASRDAGIALDAVPGGRLQVFATDEGGSPLLIAVFAPDAKQWPQVKDVAERLSGALSFV
ncbi:hypothetical protein [Nocardioides halotolerans]|jgi:hypothetical protein|uniref:hypothetical protein n=1 Tax=Nocardioides halotolerans TaxID=433660 RepID=UPI000410C2FE|nr:hypothetical protein [Nocardioides halotolerans]